MDFRQTLEASGFLPRDVMPDGLWHRCATVGHPKKRNGAYKLLTCGQTGFFQDHATETTVTTWRNGDETQRPDPLISQARAREAMNESRRKLIAATQSARIYWDACRPLRFSHPYLSAKMLSMAGCDRLRVDADGWLIIPVMIENEIMSLQRIAPDGTKRFWSGASVKGGAYIISPDKFSMTALCEGLATGLAVYQCVPNCRVIVGFDCGNMVAVAKRLEITGLAVVAADNDHGTLEKIGKNPGIDHGTEAAKQIGCGIVWPKNINGTDYADMLKELLTASIEANDSALAREKMRDADLRKMVEGMISAEIKRAVKFVPHQRREIA